MQQPDRFTPLVACNLRFQNQWEDEESGLHYNLNRYYDPDSGQYLSPDPIGLEGGLRTHGYVHDPMQWVDPLGLAGCPKIAETPKYTFRGDSRSPSSIFKEGFKPLGTSTDLPKYVRTGDPSIFVSTSKTPKVAREDFSYPGSHVYTVRPGSKGIDVNATLGKHNLAYEHEIAVPGGVLPSDIMGARQVGSNGMFSGPFIKNPNYVP